MFGGVVKIHYQESSQTQSNTEQNYKRKTFVFAPIFHELRSETFLYTQKAYFSQILFTNLSKSVLVSTFPLPR